MSLTRLSNTKGLSLIEVILAAVVFSLAVAGFYVSIDASTNMAIENKKAVASARFAQTVSENLRSAVDSATWSGAQFTIGTPHAGGTYNDPETNTLYTATYTVECNPPTQVPCAATSSRRINVSVSY